MIAYTLIPVNALLENVLIFFWISVHGRSEILQLRRLRWIWFIFIRRYTKTTEVMARWSNTGSYRANWCATAADQCRRGRWQRWGRLLSSATASEWCVRWFIFRHILVSVQQHPNVSVASFKGYLQCRTSVLKWIAWCMMDQFYRRNYDTLRRVVYKTISIQNVRTYQILYGWITVRLGQ